MTNVCIRCGGSGLYLGNGMMMTECNLCAEITSDSEIIPLDKIDRKSSSYQKALKEIMAINPKISRKEAIKMFDETYVKT